MSYNCTRWKTKKLDGFKLPVAALYKHERSDWHPEREDHDDGTVTFSIMENELCGHIEGAWFVVSLIGCSGEGSGTALDWILEPAFAESEGELVAVRIWEGGDSIDRLTVKDGKVTHEDIDI